MFNHHTNSLKLSSKTVRNHISNILYKLQVADRAQAIICAREAGLGRSESWGREGSGDEWGHSQE